MNSKKEEQIRLGKLKKIEKENINPYPSVSRREMHVRDARNSLDKSFWLAGKITAIRDHGKSKFADIKDESGKIQVYFKMDVLGNEKYQLVNLFDLGDYIEIHGEIFATHAGEITVKADDLAILTKSLSPLPTKWYGFKDTDLRYRNRFVDLQINEDVKKNLETKSNTISFLRNFMQKQGFIELETPTLQPIPGGAAAKPFITHYNILDSDFYLRVAPELYLKRLIVGGFEKVFEIGKVFRNEGFSRMHNPEFTIFEFYWTYKDYNFLMEFTEDLIHKTVLAIIGASKSTYQDNQIEFKPPYPRVSFIELLKKDSGIDIRNYRDFKSLKKEVKKRKIDLNFKEITVWSKLVDELYKKISRPKIIQPTFVIDHPIELSPLAKEKQNQPELAQRFQLTCGGGMEIVNAYSELNNPIEQEKRIREQSKMREAGWEESELLDSNFIEALKYGMPPTAGWGMGVDRFTMLLTNQHSIKEIIAFPALKPKK
ncbi:MAG: lysine--tRNA ligase [Actinomycetota bacterium]|jgi:lysyl-tRNA synthetase class 2|nr:lysine--tRNA ligase [Actinomycetota bacterium]